jgi:excisionase family DNA binding protein
MVQRADPVSGPASRRVRMLTVRGTMPILDCDEDAILRLVDEGLLAWCFDVALRKGRGSKELRIFPQSVGNFRAQRNGHLEFEEVARALTRGETETITAHEISAVLNVSSTHVYKLIAAGQLRACSNWRTGPRGSARVSVDSFVRFLAERAYPFPVADR